jgi:pimeloyl-ACP methyl ester carboxylesterase
MTTAKTTGFVEMDGGKRYYEMAGEGDTVVFCHAAFLASGQWDSQFEEFARHYRVIRFDMLGYGKSDPATAPLARRDELYQLLQHLGVERAALVGCSMSGTAVLDLAIERPEFVSAFVIVNGDPSGFESDEWVEQRYESEMIEALKAGEVERAVELQIRIWFDGPFREPADVNADARANAAAMNLIAVKNGTLFAIDRQEVNPLSPPAFRRMGEVRAPALVVVGVLDDPIALVAARAMAKEIPGAKLLEIEDAAHVPNMDHPAIFNEGVLDFLAEALGG